MDNEKKKPPPDIEGQFKVSTDLPDQPLSKLRNEIKPENIVIVERVVEKVVEIPVEKIVYRDRVAQHDKSDGLKPGQSWCGPIIAFGILIFFFLLFVLPYLMSLSVNR